MYAQYWNLARPPFENSSDPALFVRSRTHQAALMKMRYLIENNKGAGLLVGGTGFGKSFVCHMLLNDLPERFGPVIKVQYPFLNSAELLAYLAAELSGDDTDMRRDSAAVDRIYRQLQRSLIHHRDEKRHPIIHIDDAHLITDHTVFQTLQLLLNLRDESPFTLIISGQQSLLPRIARIPELEERLGVKAQLQPLSASETADYVTHRLKVCGIKQNAFHEKALTEIYELSGGVPRRINRIADLALLVGFSDKLKIVTDREVESVASEVGAFATSY